MQYFRREFLDWIGAEYHNSYSYFEDLGFVSSVLYFV